MRVGQRPIAPPTSANADLGDQRDPSNLAEPPLHRPSGLEPRRTGEVLIDIDDVALGHENRHRWKDPSQGSVNHGRIYYRCRASRDDVSQHGSHIRPPLPPP
jgi:hypothetical protein